MEPRSSGPNGAGQGTGQLPPEQPAPIRAPYQTEEELGALAAAVARGEDIPLPGYIPFPSISACLKTAS
ncbi:hypothetical protein HED49_02585 [Ochrobactrum daejeonense]|nr:hypothetical protein [Brucella daejeonensis]